MQGYTLITEEVLQDLARAEPSTHVFVPASVGGSLLLSRGISGTGLELAALAWYRQNHSRLIGFFAA
jgi:hypothetical protein